MKKIITIFRPCIFVLALIPGISLNVSGQSQMSGMVSLIPQDGFIILNTGDTIPGKIAYSKLTENFMSRIKFFGPDGVKTLYNAGEISGLGIEWNWYNYDDDSQSLIPTSHFWDIYECRPSPKKGIMVFMNRFSGGKINVFQNRSSLIHSNARIETSSKIDGISFHYSSDEGLVIGPSYKVTTRYIESRSWYSSYYVEKEGVGFIKVDKGNFELLWPALFGDCLGITEEIDKNPDLKKFKNFLLVIEVYNQICK
ncbi:MAG: hypothetical protein NT175_07070 [Bacteroidetes bacterium]|nr:hypothetical protein [Bacteroidota bacterium]